MLALTRFSVSLLEREPIENGIDLNESADLNCALWKSASLTRFFSMNFHFSTNLFRFSVQSWLSTFFLRMYMYIVTFVPVVFWWADLVIVCVYVRVSVFVSIRLSVNITAPIFFFSFFYLINVFAGVCSIVHLCALLFIMYTSIY